MKNLFFIIFGFSIVSLFYIFKYYFWPFLFSLILYLSLRPLFDRLLKYIKNRSLASTILIFLMIMAILVPSVYLLISLSDQALKFYNFIHEKLARGILFDLDKSDSLKRIFIFFNLDEAEIIQKSAESLKNISSNMLESITEIVSYPINIFVNFIFTILILFFLFKEGNRMGNAFYRSMPFPNDIEYDVINRLKEVIKVLMAGNVLVMIIQGLMVGLGLYIVGNDTPLLWGSIAAIFSLIPLVGTAVVWVPGMLFLVFNGQYFSAMFLGIWSLFWYLFLENFIKPKVFGKKLHFHPLIFFFLLLGSIRTFGLPGIILGPILLTLFYSMWEIYNLLIEYKEKVKPEEK